MSGNYTEELDAVKTDLKSLKEDISKLTETVASDARSNVNELRATASRKAKAARQRAVDAGTKGRARARGTVRDNPLTSILATAGVALIAGALFARR